jgi:DNA ligase 1
MRYSSLVSIYQKLESTPRRLEKTHILAEFLKTVPENELENVILLLRGSVFAPWDKRTLGFSSALAVKAVAAVSGESEQKVKTLWRREGDLGKVAVVLAGKQKQATLLARDLSVQEVIGTLQKLPSVEGKGSVELKVKSVASMLSSTSGEEARFLLRTVLEELRVGVAEGTLRDAIGWAFLTKGISFDIEKNELVFADDTSREHYNELIAIIQQAYDRCNDFGQVALAAKKGIKALKSITFKLGTPIRVMLAQRESSVEAGLERVGRPAALEYKYDGFRLQVHKDNHEVTLFTRRLENVTEQFPDVVMAVKEHIKAKTVLLDCEAVGFDSKTGKYMPFQHISQRIRRKYDIDELQEKLPVELNVFDILYLDGKELLNEPFEHRRELLQRLLPKPVPRKVRLSIYLKTDDTKAAERFYKESLAAGNEGIMCKALDGKYQPGSRVGHMVKVKPVLDTMDLVVTAAEWGEGKRSGWLTSFTIACQDDAELATIGKVGTGLKELEQEGGVTFEQITRLLKEDVLTESGRDVTVKPKLVLEIAFEEIQSSPSYTSGYALRFPRVIKVRDDRGVEDITTIDEVREAYERQRGRTQT